MMLKARISWNNHHAYIDLATDKGYNAIIRAMKRVQCSKDFYTVTVEDLNLRFIKKTEGYYQVLKEVIQPTESIFNVFRSTQSIKNGSDEFLSYLDNKIKNGEVQKAEDISIFEQVFIATKPTHISPSLADPNELNYTKICIFHRPALFIDCRIDKSKLPKGIHCYEAMHDDEQNGVITMIGKTIHVNFWGSILITHHIKLDNGYRDVDEKKDIHFLNEKSIKLDEFLKDKALKKSIHER